MPSLCSLQEVLDAWEVGLQYISMLSDAWVLQLFLSDDLQDVVALMASPLYRLMWSRHDRSLLFEYISSEACKVLDEISHPLQYASLVVLRILILALLVCASPRSPQVTEEGSAL